MGGMLDLSRFRQFIHEATGHSRDSIRGLVIGEHGENMLPLPRFSSVSGIPLSTMLPKEKLDAQGFKMSDCLYDASDVERYNAVYGGNR